MGWKLPLVSWRFILTHSGFLHLVVIPPGAASYLDYSVNGAYGVVALSGSSFDLLLPYDQPRKFRTSDLTSMTFYPAPHLRVCFLC